MRVGRERAILLALFVGVFLIYIGSPVMTSFDSRWSIHTSLSLIKEGNVHLNEYQSLIDENERYAIREINGNEFSIFPVGTSLLATPFVFMADISFEFLITKSDFVRSKAIEILGTYGIDTVHPTILHIHPLIEKIIASFFTALCVLVMYQIARMKMTVSGAVMFALLFAFGTAAWSTASRALWQHGPSMLLLSVALLLLLKSKENRLLIKYVAIPLALAFIVRPTNAIPIAFFSLFVLINYRREFVPYVLVAAPFALGFFAYSYLNFGSILPWYYDSDRVFSDRYFMEALAGNLISPARGLFIYSPFLLWCLVPIYESIKKHRKDSLEFFLVLTIICHWLVISSFPHWYGGHSYGPRFFSDMLPFLFFLMLVPFTTLIKETRRINGKSTIFFSLALIAISINFRGAWHSDVYLWNTTPVDISKSPERIWSWRDAQFLRFN